MGLLEVYQLVFSPYMGGSCRFRPTCSHYAKEALGTHPLRTALALILRRLGKCHPWGSWGYDPVPLASQKIREKTPC